MGTGHFYGLKTISMVRNFVEETKPRRFCFSQLPVILIIQNFGDYIIRKIDRLTTHPFSPYNRIPRNTVICMS